MTEEQKTPTPVSSLSGIKPLEWEDCGEDMGWCSDCVIGRYWIEDVHGKWQARFLGVRYETIFEEFIIRGVGFETAKDAAFADYQRRIRAALSATATEGE